MDKKQPEIKLPTATEMRQLAKKYNKEQWEILTSSSKFCNILPESISAAEIMAAKILELWTKFGVKPRE